MKRWTFRPARDHGTAVGVWLEVPFDFHFPKGTDSQATRASGHYEPPAVIERTKPVYPEFAKEAQIQGTVLLRARIDVDGAVTGIEVLQGVVGLNGTAVEAVKHWKFRAATMNGRPVIDSIDVPVVFAF